MQKTYINSNSKVWVNTIALPADWTGAQGEWQLPGGHEFVTGSGGEGHVWNGASFDPPAALPARTAAELDAEMNAYLGDPKTLSVIEAIAARLPGPVSVADLRADALIRARANLPR